METTREYPCVVECSSLFAYAQLSHLPVTGSTVKHVGHTFGGSFRLACAFL